MTKCSMCKNKAAVEVGNKLYCITHIYDGLLTQSQYDDDEYKQVYVRLIIKPEVGA